MHTYNFMLILDQPIDEATADLLYEAGLADGSVSSFEGSAAIDVDRESPSLLEALSTAIRQAESVQGVAVLRVEGEELVSQADIADRTGRSRQAVNHWIKRDAPTSGFPAPYVGASTRSPLWRWCDVQLWLEPTGTPDDRDRIIALTNTALLARRSLRGEDERLLVQGLLERV